jgi:hypothetical protein
MDSGSRSAKQSSSGMTGSANCAIVPKSKGDLWELSNRHFNELTNLLIEAKSHIPNPTSQSLLGPTPFHGGSLQVVRPSCYIR